MKIPRLNKEAPNLKWHKRRDGTKIAYWVAGGRRKTFPRTQRLWTGSGPDVMPTPREMEEIKAACRRLHREKLMQLRAPDRRLTHGWVYFIQSNGLIKIGFSKNVKRRIVSLQIGAAEPVVLLGTIAGSQVTEKDVHRLFAKELVRGEWFKPSAMLLAYIERERERTEPDVPVPGVGMTEERL